MSVVEDACMPDVALQVKAQSAVAKHMAIFIPPVPFFVRCLFITPFRHTQGVEGDSGG
jgi:hypothetical protein